MNVTKRKIGKTTPEMMKVAVNLVLENKLSVRKVSTTCKVPFETLRRYVTMQKSNPEVPIQMSPRYDNKKVFTHEQEELIANYLKVKELHSC